MEPESNAQPTVRGGTNLKCYLSVATMLSCLWWTMLLIGMFQKADRFEGNQQKKGGNKRGEAAKIVAKLRDSKQWTEVQYESEIKGWEKNVSRDVTIYVHPFKDTTFIHGKNICGTVSKKLVIVVTTSPSHFKRRRVIRQTWGSGTNTLVRIGFLVGWTQNETEQASIEEESERFHDMIQEDFMDSYKNLTLKSVFMLKWYIRNCRNSQFLMKSDDDTFVDVDLLVNQLENYYGSGILMGDVSTRLVVDRGSSARFAVPTYMYPNATYPSYLFGFAYVMSGDVAEKLFAAALRTPLLHVEDVFVTGICAREAAMTPRQFPGAAKYTSFPNLEERCSANYSLCNPMNPSEMHYLWRARRNMEWWVF